MNLLKKIKFGHILLVIMLYMGVNIGLKIQKISVALYGTPKESNTVLLDTYDFDGTPIEFYRNNSSTYAMMNGIKISFQSGYFNEDRTRHIYIEQWEKRTITQNGEIIEPVFKIESNEFKNIYIYEFDINSTILGKPIDEKEDYVIKTEYFDNEKTGFIETTEINIDLNNVKSLMKNWRELSYSETLDIKTKNKISLLNIQDNWHVYAFDHCNFSPNSYHISLLENEGIYLSSSLDHDSAYYELTETQYNEFIEMIKSSKN